MIYNEVAPMLYTKTHFHFPHPADLSLFSERVGQARLQSIRIMSFDVGDFDTGFSIEAAAQVKDGTALYSSGLNGLKELRVLVKKAVLEVSLLSLILPLVVGVCRGTCQALTRPTILGQVKCETNRSRYGPEH